MLESAAGSHLTHLGKRTKLNENMLYCLMKAENIVTEEKIAHDERTLSMSQCSQRLSAAWYAASNF